MKYSAFVAACIVGAIVGATVVELFDEGKIREDTQSLNSAADSLVEASAAKVQTEKMLNACMQLYAESEVVQTECVSRLKACYGAKP